MDKRRLQQLLAGLRIKSTLTTLKDGLQAKQAAARWRTGVNLLKILQRGPRMEPTAGLLGIPRTVVLNKARVVLGQQPKSLSPRITDSINKQVGEAGITVEDLGRQAASKLFSRRPLDTIYRSASPNELLFGNAVSGHYGKNWRHGSPFPGVASQYASKGVGGHLPRLMQSYSALPRQKYAPNFTLEEVLSGKQRAIDGLANAHGVDVGLRSLRIRHGVKLPKTPGTLLATQQQHMNTLGASSILNRVRQRLGRLDTPRNMEAATTLLHETPVTRKNLLKELYAIARDKAGGNRILPLNQYQINSLRRLAQELDKRVVM